jgi:hypothetical protein
LIPVRASNGMAMAAAATTHSSSSSGWMSSRWMTLRYAAGAVAAMCRTTHAAISRLNRAMTLVKRLSLTTVVYSSGPVTPWMWKLRDPSPSSRQKPRSAHIRAVSTRMSMPSRHMKSSSPLAATYLQSAKEMSASMWYCAVPAA